MCRITYDQATQTVEIIHIPCPSLQHITTQFCVICFQMQDTTELNRGADTIPVHLGFKFTFQERNGLRLPYLLTYLWAG